MTVINDSKQDTENQHVDSTLTALDRCDACGAQAYVRAKVGDSGELLFCAHHARKHAPVLEQVAQIIEDESDRLSQPVF